MRNSWIVLIFGLVWGGANIRAEENLTTPQKEYQLLVVACGRSGTMYMASLLKNCGMDVRHEALGSDGCVSWPMLFDECWIGGPHQSKDTFEHVLHQIRDPLLVITSWFENCWWETEGEGKAQKEHKKFMWKNVIWKNIPEIHKEEPFLVQCAKYWYYWNLKAEEVAEWTYRIEDLEEIFPEFERRIGRRLNADLLKQIPKNVNHYYSTEKKITWAFLQKNLPEELFSNIQTLAEKHGYPITD